MEAFVDDGTDLSANANLGTVDKFYLTGDGAEVTLSATQASGKQVLLADGVISGTVTISGDVARGTADLTGISGDVALDFDGDSITVGDGATLQLTLAQAAALSAAGQTIDGDGTLLLDGGVADGETLDLTVLVEGNVQIDFVEPPVIENGGRLILALASAHELETDDTSVGWINLIGDVPAGETIDITGVTTNIGNFSFNEPGAAGNGCVIPETSVLLARADQVDTTEITGDGTLRIVGIATGRDYSDITADIDLTQADVTDGLPIFAEGGLVEGQVLTLTSEQAHERQLSSGAGRIVVQLSDNAADGDFSQLTGDVVLEVTSDLVFTGTRGDASIYISNSVATFHVNSLNGVSVSGVGATLNIAGDVGWGQEQNFSGIDADVAVTFNDYDNDTLEVGDDNTIDVVIGGTLILKAEHVSGASITGGGLVRAVGAEPGTAYDFSTVVPDLNDDMEPILELRVEYADDGTINPDTNFTGVYKVLLADGVTTMTAAQADGLGFWDSADGASVNITGSDGVQNLQDTDGNDTIATGAGADFVGLWNEGSDRVVFHGTLSKVVVDVEVDGFTTGDGGDILDFSLISGLAVGGYTAFDMVEGGDSLTTGVVGILGAFAETAANVQSLFNQAQGFLNGKVDGSSPSDMVFLISNPADDEIRVWYWKDGDGAASDENVQSAELTLLGTLTSLTNSDLQTLTSQNFVV